MVSDTLIGQGVSLSRLIGACTPSVTATDAVSSALAPRRHGERLLSIREEMTRANVFVASKQANKHGAILQKKTWQRRKDRGRGLNGGCGG